MRTMYDGIAEDAQAIAKIPSAIDLIAGYDDGDYAWSPEDWTLFPNSVKVHIAVHPTTNSGHVLDVETGNADPEQAVNWVLMRRAAGADPTVYCSTSTWPSVRSAFDTHDVAEPHYWIADYDNDPTIPAGAIGHQYENTARWDRSSVADYWPGVDDPNDPYGVPEAPPKPQEDDMSTTSVNGRAGLSWAASSRHVVQVSCDPADSGNKPFTLRGALVFEKTPATPGAFVFQLTVDEGGTGEYEIPANLIPLCRGAILKGATTPIYDATAV